MATPNFSDGDVYAFPHEIAVRTGTDCWIWVDYAKWLEYETSVMIDETAFAWVSASQFVDHLIISKGQVLPSEWPEV